MGRRSTDLQGQQFGNLRVLDLFGIEANASRAALWRCECSCGNIHTVRASNLTGGHTTRCASCSHRRNTPQAPTAVLPTHPLRIAQLWCAFNGDQGGFARVVDCDGHVLCRTHLSRSKLRIRSNAASTPMIRRCLLTLEFMGMIGSRQEYNSFTRWAKASNVTLNQHMFTPEQQMQELWFQSVHAPELAQLQAIHSAKVIQET